MNEILTPDQLKQATGENSLLKGSDIQKSNKYLTDANELIKNANTFISTLATLKTQFQPAEKTGSSNAVKIESGIQKNLSANPDKTLEINSDMATQSLTAMINLYLNSMDDKLTKEQLIAQLKEFNDIETLKPHVDKFLKDHVTLK